jgi:hypothetical protein
MIERYYNTTKDNGIFGRIFPINLKREKVLHTTAATGGVENYIFFQSRNFFPRNTSYLLRRIFKSAT